MIVSCVINNKKKPTWKEKKQKEIIKNSIIDITLKSKKSM